MRLGQGYYLVLADRLNKHFHDGTLSSEVLDTLIHFFKNDKTFPKGDRFRELVEKVDKWKGLTYERHD